MNYPVVKHSHVVPRSYLVNFADERKKLRLRLKDRDLQRDISVKDAAVVADFYKRERLDGTVIYDIEWSLQHLENVCAPILRTLEERWPLGSDDKAALASLFAYQTVRGTRWKAWHEGVVTGRIAGYRKELVPGSEDAARIEAELDAAERHLLGSTYRHTKMLNIAPKVAALLGSMHWTLLRFDDNVIATSDHPVVAWQRSERTRIPGPTPTGAGFRDTLEVRVPASARHAIVMTWRDAPDGRIERGSHHASINLNTLTAANADRQWFHHPSAAPQLARGALKPVSPEFVRGYAASEARTSARRAKIIQRLAPRIHDQSLDQSFEIVTVP